MPRQQAAKAHRERNEALVDAMLVAAVADGQVSRLELRTLLRRMHERPEFEGLSLEAIGEIVQARSDALSSLPMSDVLDSLRARLPEHSNRLLAFGLAAAVAFADQRATRSELGLLKTLQAALGITEDEVVRIVDVVERGGSLTEALGEPPERLFAEVLVLMSTVDGRMSDAESAALVENLVSDPAFSAVAPREAQSHVLAALAALQTEGLPARIQQIAHGLATHAQRLKAYRLALRLARVDGGPDEAKQHALDLLQASLGLNDDELAQLTQDA